VPSVPTQEEEVGIELSEPTLMEHRFRQVEDCRCVHCRPKPAGIPQNLINTISRELQTLSTAFDSEQRSNNDFYSVIVLCMEIMCRNFTEMDELRAALKPMELVRRIVLRNFGKLQICNHAGALNIRYGSSVPRNVNFKREVRH